MNLTKERNNLLLKSLINKNCRALKAGLQGIRQARGKAVPGDKTMVDIWQTVIDDLKNTEYLLIVIIEAAKEKDKDMQAKRPLPILGRTLIGHIDPGAASKRDPLPKFSPHNT